MTDTVTKEDIINFAENYFTFRKYPAAQFGEHAEFGWLEGYIYLPGKLRTKVSAVFVSDKGFPDIETWTDKDHAAPLLSDARLLGFTDSDSAYAWAFGEAPHCTPDSFVAGLKPLLKSNIYNRAPREWIPSDFPVGTKFICAELTRHTGGADKDGKPTVFTAIGIHASGPNHYVVETDVFDELVGLNTSFALGHVTEILSQPKKKVFKYGSLDKSFKGSPKFNYLGGNAKNVSVYHVAIYASQFVPFGCVIDTETFTRYISRTMTARKAKDGYGLQYSRKKLKRAILQNLNRFLVNPAKAQNEYDEEMDRYMSESFKDDFLVRYPDEGTDDPSVDEEPPFDPEGQYGRGP